VGFAFIFFVLAVSLFAVSQGVTISLPRVLEAGVNCLGDSGLQPDLPICGRRVEDGTIVDRIQQADIFGQFRQLFTPLLLGVLIALCVLLNGIGLVIGALVL
jgi:hypothetical protein